LEGNFYKTWIENYASDEFSDSFEWFYDALDNLVSNMSDKQREKITEIFISSVEFEYLFWDMSYKRQMSY
jgi:thiaminase/transcriptional activator TenA